jgi:hypothetical protein
VEIEILLWVLRLCVSDAELVESLNELMVGREHSLLFVLHALVVAIGKPDDDVLL